MVFNVSQIKKRKKRQTITKKKHNKNEINKNTKRKTIYTYLFTVYYSHDSVYLSLITLVPIWSNFLLSLSHTDYLSLCLPVFSARLQPLISKHIYYITLKSLYREGHK